MHRNIHKPKTSSKKHTADFPTPQSRVNRHIRRFGQYQIPRRPHPSEVTLFTLAHPPLPFPHHHPPHPDLTPLRPVRPILIHPFPFCLLHRRSMLPVIPYCPPFLTASRSILPAASCCRPNEAIITDHSVMTVCQTQAR